jgi:DNA-directed RNA polymerase subunit RPC12/RpoP
VTQVQPENGLQCSYCKRNVPLKLGMAPGVILQSVELQAKVLGIEIHCSSCGKDFIYHGSHTTNMKIHFNYAAFQ